MKRFETDAEKLYALAEAEIKADEENDGLSYDNIQAQVIGLLAFQLSRANTKLNTLVRFMEMTMEDGK